MRVSTVPMSPVRLAERAQGRLDEVGGRRLAVGAGDPDHRQVRPRVAIDGRGDATEAGSRTVADEDRNAGRPVLLDGGRPCMVGDHGDGAQAHGITHEPCPHERAARKGGIEVTRPDRPAVERDARDGEVRRDVRCSADAATALSEDAQGHARRRGSDRSGDTSAQLTGRPGEPGRRSARGGRPAGDSSPPTRGT